MYEPSAFTPGSLAPRGKIEELLRFTFPRQADREGLCLSDYFRPAESSKFDVLALQVVTVGPYVDELGAALNKRGEYAQALFVHGLGVSAAAGLADGITRRFARSWASSRSAAIATRSATARAPTSRIRRSCSS